MYTTTSTARPTTTTTTTTTEDPLKNCEIPGLPSSKEEAQLEIEELVKYKCIIYGQ